MGCETTRQPEADAMKMKGECTQSLGRADLLGALPTRGLKSGLQYEGLADMEKIANTMRKRSKQWGR